MDKEVLAIVGRLYLENMGLINYTEGLKARIEELEQLVNKLSSAQKIDKGSKSGN